MTELQKQPFKIIEIPLNKFNDEAIPHHKKIFDQHKAAIHKLISTNKLDLLNKEVKEKKRVIWQLRDLQYELDTLRTQVEHSDLDKFDEKTFSLRKIISALIKDYTALEKQVSQLTESHNEVLQSENPFEGASQIQIQGNLSEIKLQEEEDRLKNIESIEVDVQDLHKIYVDLNEMVCEQRQSVDIVENNVENTNENVNEGLKQLIRASKLKTAVYPITGALVGTLVGGPVGMLAGFKVGGIAAIGCGIVGYTGGNYFKKCNSIEIAATENEINERQEDDKTIDNTETVNKKDM